MQPGPERLAWVGLGVAMAAAAALIFYLGRETTFFYDEWNFLLDRRGLTVNTFLAPHGGHLSIVPIAIYHLVWSAAGLQHYGAYRAVVIGVHLLCAGLLFEIARRRIPVVFALAMTALLLFMGSAWQDLLWPFQIGFLASLAAGLGTLLALDHDTRRADVIAAALLTISLGASGLGIPIVAGVVVELTLRRHWRRLWIAIGPTALFAVWYLAWRHDQAGVQLSNLGRLPAYVARSAVVAFAGLSGLTGQSGWIAGSLLLVALILTAVALRRSWRSPRLALLLVTPLAFWCLTALTRGQLDEPGASRYLYPGGLFLLLLFVEAMQHVPRLPVVAIALAVPMIYSNVLLLHGGALGLRAISVTVRAELGALELAQGHVAPGFQPDTQLMPQVSAARYLAAVHALGSPADSPMAIEQAPEPARVAADHVLEGALDIQPTPGAGCSSDRVAALPTQDLVVPPSGLWILDGTVTPAVISLRRFASDYAAPLGLAPPSIWVHVIIPPDAVATPWHARVTGNSVYLCIGPASP